jgi:hypothetical protein
VPPALETILGGGYLYSLGPDRSVEWCRAVIARSARASNSLVRFSCSHLPWPEHMTRRRRSDDLFNAVDRAANPMSISGAFCIRPCPSCGRACCRIRSTSPGLVVAQDSGNRQMEPVLCSAQRGSDPRRPGGSRLRRTGNPHLLRPGPGIRLGAIMSAALLDRSNGMRLPPLSAHSLKSRSHVAHTPKSTPPRASARSTRRRPLRINCPGGMTMSNTAMASCT